MSVIRSFRVALYAVTPIALIAIFVCAPAAAKETPANDSPGVVAKRLRAALHSGDDDVLTEIAKNPDNDPWRLISEVALLSLDDAEAFANVVKVHRTKEVDKLVDYVKRLRQDDALSSEKRSKRRATHRAAQEAYKRRELEEAHRLLKDVESWPLDVESLDAIEQLAFVEFRMRTGRFYELLARVATDAESLGWLRRAAATHKRLANYYSMGKRTAITIDSLKRAGALYASIGDDAASCRALSHAAAVLIGVGQQEEAGSILASSLPAARRVGDKTVLARHLLALARIRVQAGTLDHALELCNEAWDLCKDSDDHVAKSAIQQQFALLAGERGNRESLYTHYANAIAFAERAGNSDILADMLTKTANNHLVDHRPKEALPFLRRARRAAQKVRSPAVLVRVNVSLATVHDALGNRDASRRALHEAKRGVERCPATSQVWFTATIGAIHRRLGHYAEAIHLLEKAVDLGDSLKQDVGHVWVELGHSHVACRNLDAALQCYSQAQSSATRQGNKAVLRGATLGLGSVAFMRDDMPAAAKAFRTVFRDPNAKPGMAYSAGSLLAQCMARMGNDKVALALVQETERAWASTSLPPHVNGIDFTRGQVERSIGDHAAALASFRRAYEVNRRMGYLRSQSMAAGGISGALFALGKKNEALTWARRAVDVGDAMTAPLASVDAHRARDTFRPFYEFGVSSAAELGDVNSLLYLAEHGRARAIRESLAERQHVERATLGVEEQQRLDEARRRVTELRKKLERQSVDSTSDASKRHAAELIKAQESLIRITASLERSRASAHGGTCPIIDDPDDVQATVRSDEALVTFVEGAGETLALVFTDKTTRIVRVGSTKTIEQLVSPLLENHGGGLHAKSIATLSKRLVEPLELGDKKTVIVSPSGALAYVPMALLMPRRHVAHVPSAMSHVMLRSEVPTSGTGVLALGDARYNAPSAGDMKSLAWRSEPLSPLPASGDEARAVGDTVLLGKEANVTELLKSLDRKERWRSVHLACHGVVDPSRPLLSSLVISADEQHDGYVSALDLLHIDVRADLAVLSACETAKGKVYRAEGVVGLTSAFMASGARRVITSLWRVDDSATKALMTKFYALWNPKDGTPGLPTAEALKQAQAHVRSHPKWAHPKFWAAWVLWGLPE